MLAEPAYDVLAVELSSYQLHWTSTVGCQAAAILNLAPDHLDWHGSVDGYAGDKARIWAPGTVAVFNADDDATRRLAAARHDSGPAPCRSPSPSRRRASSASWPAPSSSADRTAPSSSSHLSTSCSHRLRTTSPTPSPPRRWRAPSRSAPDAVAAGLRAFRPDPHRIDLVASIDGVDYVDDSKATNAHAAAASLAAFPQVVWIAGGLAKGAAFDELVAGAADRLRGVVLLGQDRALIADALARHAPEVPVVDVPATDTGAMDDVVRAARGLVRPGDTVLLAPACASMDMFTNYGERGDAFAAAVRRLTA